MFAALNGPASSSGIANSIAYIHRDDFQNLLWQSVSQLSINSYIEKPQEFRDNIVETFLRVFSSKVAVDETFSNEMFHQTYNSEDLTPNRIRHYLDHRLNENEKQQMRKRDVNGHASGSSLLGSVDFGFSFNQESASRFMEKHDMLLELDGDIYVPKTLFVRKINLNQFSDINVLTETTTWVEEITKQTQRFIDLSSLRSSAGTCSEYYSDCSNQLRNKEEQLAQIENDLRRKENDYNEMIKRKEFEMQQYQDDTYNRVCKDTVDSDWQRNSDCNVHNEKLCLHVGCCWVPTPNLPYCYRPKPDWYKTNNYIVSFTQQLLI